MFCAIQSVFSARPKYLNLDHVQNWRFSGGESCRFQLGCGLGKLLPLITAGVLLSGSAAMATTKAPIKLDAANRPAIQLAQTPLSTSVSITPATPTEPTVSTVSGALADGIYFFGASPERDQLDTEYIVFKVDQDQVVGAFYLPSSNFDCFHGEVEADVMALQITNSYDQAVHSYDIAMESVPSTVAGAGAGAFGPAGFYAMGQLSELEHGLLSTCQANYLDAI